MHRQEERNMAKESKGYVFRIYPTEEQKRYINQCIAAKRWWWNYVLGKINQIYEETKKHTSAIDFDKELPILKKQPETSWLKKVDSTLFHYVEASMDDSFDRFFKKQGGKPEFKSKTYDGSYTSHILTAEIDTCIDFEHGYIKLRKAGKVKTVFHRKFKGTPTAFHISKKSFDWYEVSIQTSTQKEKVPMMPVTYEGTVGIDLGVKQDSNAILSDGKKFQCVDTSRLEVRKKRLQKKLARQQRKVKTGEKVFSKRYNKEVDKTVPSKNYIKTKDKIAKICNKIQRIRKYNTNQITAYVANNNDINTVCMENLNLKGMVKNHNLANRVTNANMGELKTQLQYKLADRGKHFVQVDRFFASSQTCSCCGYVNKDVKNLNVRSWICPNCHTKHDRDVNAAINIKNEGYRILTEGKL